MLLKTDLSYKIQKKFKIDLLGENIFLKLKHICPYQLGNKCSKQTILNILINEKYFLDLLIYQLVGFNFAKIQLTSSYEIIFALDFALIVTIQLIYKQN